MILIVVLVLFRAAVDCQYQVDLLIILTILIRMIILVMVLSRPLISLPSAHQNHCNHSNDVPGGQERPSGPLDRGSGGKQGGEIEYEVHVFGKGSYFRWFMMARRAVHSNLPVATTNRWSFL